MTVLHQPTTVRDILGLIRKTLGVGREHHIVQRTGQTLVRQTGWDDPAVKVEHLRVPQHGDGLILLFDQAEQTTVVGRAHDNFTIR
jgi:hypothetical protein